MKRSVLRSVYIGLVVVALSACGPPPEPEPDPADALPPPPTPMEIATKISQQAQLEGPLPPRGAAVPPAVRQQIIGVFKDAKNQHSGTQDGDEVLGILSRKLSSRIDATNEAKLYQHAITYIESYDVLNPGSARYNGMKRRVLDELSKPKVEMIGLADVSGRRYAQLRISDPLTGNTQRIQLEPGEESNGLRLLEWFGAYRGVEMEYIKTGERFTVLFNRSE